MLVLISPVSYEEAASIVDSGVDIIDIKNVNEGSLGAQFPWHTREVAELSRAHGIKASATLGDLPYKPGTAALAAYGAAQCASPTIRPARMEPTQTKRRATVWRPFQSRPGW